ncbi:hypothetical protein Glove_421g65 [Diversispora epigaea]|uniref:Uncharacterized protein n=1 Tax=Diversispora epigaea TaxID=1348612 RepID=A0A397GVT7_9GLOM|nr:hypothetical protein Glove_421g65 [Diversispora epigaea]
MNVNSDIFTLNSLKLELSQMLCMHHGTDVTLQPDDVFGKHSFKISADGPIIDGEHKAELLEVIA